MASGGGGKGAAGLVAGLVAVPGCAPVLLVILVVAILIANVQSVISLVSPDDTADDSVQFPPDAIAAVCAAYTASPDPGDPSVPGCPVPDPSVAGADAAVMLPGGWAWPVPPGTLQGSGFGYRAPLSTQAGSTGTFHTGVDLEARCGTPIHVIHAGTVISAGGGTTNDTGVITVDMGGGQQSIYEHWWSKDLYVHVGQQLQAGDVIALVGMSGFATGCHLHLGIRISGTLVDPVPYLAAIGITYPKKGG